MNRTPRLSKSGIEYLDYVWNFCSGCTNGCAYCWARPITKRFPERYPNGFEPTVYPEAFLSPLHLKKPRIIGCVFMGDLFDESVNPNRRIESWLPSGTGSISMSLKGWISTTIKQCPQHTFLFLTKQPQNLIKFSPFPENCWVGVTATDGEKLYWAVYYLSKIEAKIKYLSIEPFLDWTSPEIWLVNPLSGYLSGAGINWVIIGAQTRPTVFPKIEWVREIVDACDKARVSVFLKDNLRRLWDADLFFPEWAMNKHDFSIRQEMPK